MMRYQRVSPDCLPLANGRKPNLRTCKDDDHTENGRIPNFSNFEGKSLRVRSGSNPSTSQQETHHFPHFALSDSPAHSENHVTAKNLTHEIGGGGSSGSPGRGDVLLQWGHNKRSRGSRTAGDESSGHGRPASKIHRRGTSSGAVDKQAMTSMPPPPPCAGYSRGANLRPCMPPIRDSTGSLLNRAVEERSGGHPRPEKRSPPSPPEKAQKMAMGGSIPTANGGSTAPQADPTNHLPSTPSSEQEAGGGSGCGAAPAGTTEKLNMDLFEWPRIYINLSRKEKEDDFLAMKGSKLPQRPKKRAKNVDKTLQYCFPGMWLSDLTRGRYEVREKKCVKKKRRGLKGMESMDSESE